MARPRKTEVDADTQAKLIAAIKLGATYELAAQYAGVTYRTLRNWITRAEAEEEGFIHFLQALKEAEGRGAFALLTKINNAADDGNWQAAAWILERRYPDMYGKQRVEHTGKDGDAISIRLVRETGFNPTPKISESDE